MRAPSILPVGGVWLATRVIFQPGDHRPKCQPAADGWGWEQHFTSFLWKWRAAPAASQKNGSCHCSAFAAFQALAIDMLMLRLPAGQRGMKVRAVHRGPAGEPLGSRHHCQPLQGQHIQIRAKQRVVAIKSSVRRSFYICAPSLWCEYYTKNQIIT